MVELSTRVAKQQGIERWKESEYFNKSDLRDVTVTLHDDNACRWTTTLTTRGKLRNALKQCQSANRMSSALQVPPSMVWLDRRVGDAP